MTSTDLRTLVVEELEAVRQRSLDLLAPLDEEQLVRQHSRIMSPLVWDLAHVGNFEELWLLRAVNGDKPIDAALDDVYDAFRHPRPNRPSLPLLGPADAQRYLVEVRGRALDILDRVKFGDGAALLDDGFVYGMVVQHEHQHDETMLATIQLMEGDGYRPLAPAPPPGSPLEHHEVLIPSGPFVMGTDTYAWAYDNERPAHVVDLPAYWIDTAPVTNGQYLGFIGDGGYQNRRWWDDAGWDWRLGGEPGSEIEHPLFWSRDSGTARWLRNRFGWQEAVPLDEPVQHVSWHEASAYARWAGRRLPSEAEWEKAASWAPDGHKRRYPWGDEAQGSEIKPSANLGQRHFRPAPVGAYPTGVSASGCHQLVGDVWEWTSSEFEPYPGFCAFPYKEYSEVFFGSGYKVLRGGSWATHPAAVRTTFRNWDHPIRRQIFSGFRTALSGDA